LPEIHQIPFGGRALPRPTGEGKGPPYPLAAIRGPTSKGRGGDGGGEEETGEEAEASAVRTTFQKQTTALATGS